MNLLLEHDNGDVRDVTIVRAVDYVTRHLRRPSLTISYPLWGHYSLDLRKNVLTKVPAWHAKDLKDAWGVWFRMTGARGKLDFVPVEYRNCR